MCLRKHNTGKPKVVLYLCVTALGGPTEEELLELLDQCDLALTRTPDMSPAASLTHSSRNSMCRYTHLQSYTLKLAPKVTHTVQILQAYSLKSSTLYMLTVYHIDINLLYLTEMWSVFNHLKCAEIYILKNFL